MYKKHIKRGNKNLGPYYYESVREKTGKIKTVYLGTDPDSAKFKEKLANLRNKTALPLDNTLSKGEVVVISIEPEKIERPRRLDKKPDDLLNLSNLFSKGSSMFNKFKKASTNVLEVPSPGKKDFDFENVLFVFISLLYLTGFFYLESSITGFTVAQNTGSLNAIPVLSGLISLILILMIYVDLRRKN